MHSRIRPHPNFKKRYHAYSWLVLFILAVTFIASKYLLNKGVGVLVIFSFVFLMFAICIWLLKSKKKFLFDVKCYKCLGKATLLEPEEGYEKFYAICDACDIQWDLDIKKHRKTTDHFDVGSSVDHD